MGVSISLAIKSGESKPPRKLLFFREIFSKHKQNPYENRVGQFMGKSFRGFPLDRFRTDMWNMNITYRGQKEIFEKHKQNPYKNEVGNSQNLIYKKKNGNIT